VSKWQDTITEQQYGQVEHLLRLFALDAYEGDTLSLDSLCTSPTRLYY
jgi:hypothetical protein